MSGSSQAVELIIAILAAAEHEQEEPRVEETSDEV